MVLINKKNIWNEILESLKVSVSDAIFSTWFSHTYLVKVEKLGKRYLTEIGCPSPFVKTTIESRYYGLIQDSLSKSLGSPCDLVVTVKPMQSKSSTTTPAPLFDKDEKDEDNLEKLITSGIRLNFTFDNYAVSSSNQMAWAAAEAVSKDPVKAYNPLFIWGGVGVGKTHLMNAIGHKIVEKDKELKIFFCTGEQFTNDIVEGIRNKSTQSFRNKYRKAKVLLIDDIQFIAGKNAVQEEFFHTFNALVGLGAQIVLTSDQPPSDISKLEERLRSRFEAGLIVDISPPDFELRCAICQFKLKDRGLDLPMDLIQLLAGNIDSARKIEGFIIKLATTARIRKKNIDEEMIESLLGKGSEKNNQIKKYDSNDLITAVSKYFSIGKRSLLGTSRTRPIALPRQILMYLLRTQLGLPLQEVGRLIGGRDHTTVMYAVDKITHLTSEDVQIRQDIRGIKNLL